MRSTVTMYAIEKIARRRVDLGHLCASPRFLGHRCRSSNAVLDAVWSCPGRLEETSSGRRGRMEGRKNYRQYQPLLLRRETCHSGKAEQQIWQASTCCAVPKTPYNSWLSPALLPETVLESAPSHVCALDVEFAHFRRRSSGSPAQGSATVIAPAEVCLISKEDGKMTVFLRAFRAGRLRADALCV